MRSSICSPPAFKLRDQKCHINRLHRGGDEYVRVARYTPFPLVVIHVHCVPGFVSAFSTLSSTPDVQSKDGFCVKVGLLW